MNIGDECSVMIEKLLYGGCGLGKVNGLSVFVHNAVPDDVVKIKITRIHKNYLEGEIIEVEKESQSRVKAVCPLSKVCGSCDWLCVSYDEQLKQKQQIIEEALKREGISVKVDGIIPSPKQTEYRCKIQLPYGMTKMSKRLLSGYYKRGTHELVNIKHCHLQPNIINDINEYLKEEARKLGITGYNETTRKGILRHVVYRVSSDLSQILVIFVINTNIVEGKLKQLSDILKRKYECIAGICANFNTMNTNVIMGKKTETIIGKDYYIEVLGDKSYKISATSFFQVNPYCAKLVFDRVKTLISQRIKSPVILDAYAGVSSFGIWLSDIAKEVVSIEEVVSASRDAAENVKLNGVFNLKIINGDAGKKFKELIENGVTFDVSITDPPRKGCTKESLEYLSKLTSKYIIYVSCNPSTLARDIKILTELGFNAEYVQGADMFPNTYHVETICLLKNIRRNFQ